MERTHGFDDDQVDLCLTISDHDGDTLLLTPEAAHDLWEKLDRVYGSKIRFGLDPSNTVSWTTRLSTKSTELEENPKTIPKKATRKKVKK